MHIYIYIYTLIGVYIYICIYDKLAYMYIHVCIDIISITRCIIISSNRMIMIIIGVYSSPSGILIIQ